MPDTIIYLDNHATTAVDPRVFAAMEPYFKSEFGNPASRTHAYGWETEKAVQKAREQVASLIGADPREIVFTSGATESNNLAIWGLLEKNKSQAPHMITSNVEHSSTMEIAKEASKRDFNVTVVPANQYGQLEADKVATQIKNETILISTLFANNEVGTLNPVTELGQLAEEHKVLLHLDAAQAAGKVRIDVQKMGIHMLSLSGHKMYGPKGVGALYVRSKNPRIRLKPILTGAGQEGGLRPGTLNVPAIVGLGKACEIAIDEIEVESTRHRQLRDQLWQGLLERFPSLKLNGHPTDRLSQNLNFSIPDCLPDRLWANMKGLAISSGSACSSGSTRPSHVLTALGVEPELSRATLRLGLGRFTEAEDISQTLEILSHSISQSLKKA